MWLEPVDLHKIRPFILFKADLNLAIINTTLTLQAALLSLSLQENRHFGAVVQLATN